MMRDLYEGREEEGHAVARNLLFHIAHFFGRSDAKRFHQRLGLEDPIAKLSAGPVHFAHTGWASVEILPESHPVPSEDFLLVYDHPYSFESESWKEHAARVNHPICFMNAGYSSGWCEESFGIPLVAAELTCTAKTDPWCRFVMAHPAHIEAHIRKYLQEHPEVARHVTTYEVPGEFVRKAVDERLRLSEDRYRLLFSSARDAILLLEDGAIQEVNRSGVDLFGMGSSQLVGKQLVALSPDKQPDGRQSVDVLTDRMARARDGDSQLFAWRFEGPVGRAIDTEMSLNRVDGRRGCLLAVARDITERLRTDKQRLRLEREVRELQKMEALGTLAGGIAHDFNNLLAGISCNVDVIARQSADNPAAVQSLGDMRLILNRAAGLVRQLLSFSTTSQEVGQRVDVNAVVGDSVRMIREMLDRRVQLEVELASAVADVVVDPNQLTQVVVNLVVNARDALIAKDREGAGNAKVRVATELVRRPAPTSADGAVLGVVDWVRITVEDNGVGMDEETNRRVFEPFYTTKPIGRGTGLGMTIVYGIVKRHGGWMKVESELGRGTRVHVLLPTAKDSRLRAEPRSDAPHSLVGRETILFVDDEDLLRQAVAAMLGGLGYQVLVASDGAEALAVLDKEHERIDVVLLDFAMPGMSGAEVFDEILRRWPSMRLIVTSGHAALNAGRLLDAGAVAFLPKPFDETSLARTIRGVLDGSDA